ncbi:MAG: helix-turn-helix transcriptional regulator [Candidatus Thorarchaeota archaeon]
MVNYKHALIATVFILVLFSTNPFVQVNGQQIGNQDILMTNMDIKATLETDCGTSLIIQSEVWNVGTSTNDFFDVRIDVRSLNVNSASLNGTVVETTIIPESNYMVVRIYPITAMTAGSSFALFLNLTTQCLQEEVGLDDNQTMYLSHLIFYIRPLNEVQNLTFTAILPAHAVLQTDVSAPLFPTPSSNYTDGQSSIFIWFNEQLLPGQEVAYIVKYEIPAAIMQTAPPQASFTQLIPLGLLFLIVGAVAVLFVERIPTIISRLKTRTVITPIRLSKQEEDILSFLSKRGGSCPQREIYEELDMSQSLASTILTSLEERKLIRRFREGRENMVHIMEDM